MLLAVLIVAAYIVGSFPFGAWLSRMRGVDILSVGSGNIGATNVYRTLGPFIGVTVMILDIAKSMVPALIARAVFKNEHDVTLYALICGLSAVLGHCFSPFLKFKGGKGISTGLGALAGATPWVALVAVVTFILVTATTRYVSLASIFAAFAVFAAGFVFNEGPILVGIYGGLALFIVYKHRGNIRRLLNGTERRFSISNKQNNEGGNLPKDADERKDSGIHGDSGAEPDNVNKV